MSEIETLITEQLAKHDLEKIASGFRFNRQPHGTTDLTFRPTSMPRGEWGLCSIATVKTCFISGMPGLTTSEIERLNRRSVFGNFYLHEDAIHLKLSFSIYEKEPAVNWVSFLLLTAFGEQLSCGIGIAQSDISEELLRYNRSNLEYPRQWPEPVDPKLLSESSQRFNEIGYVSTVSSHGLVLEVPLAPGGRAVFIDPTSETALLHIVVDAPHPIIGAGHLCTIALPFDPPRHEAPAWCTYLNALEHELDDFVPKLGAWGLRGVDNQVVYSAFLPATDKFSISPSTLMNWMIQRTLWIKNNFWVEGVGLQQRKALQ